MKTRRVVVTGLGVVAPNGVGLPAFTEALRQGRSGISFRPELAALNFSCQVAGLPPVTEADKARYFSELTLRSLKSSGVIYGVMAGCDAWADAGLEPVPPEAEPDWRSGCVFGSGMTGIEALRDGALLVDEGKVRKLGSRLIEQAMASAPSAFLGGRLGLGNQVSTNASACSTGTEAVLLAADRIRAGLADRMLAGSCDSQGPYVWGGFDSMRVLTRKHNDEPEAASRPLSATARGFVPGAGGGALVLEALETAQARGARIYAEVLGGSVSAGGQRGGGSMTAPNPAGMRHCLRQALQAAAVNPSEIDLVSGHLTATMGDPKEVAAWAEVLGRQGKNFPYLQAPKSLFGHCLSAAGSIETVAAVLQLHHDFLHPSRNCEDLHPEVAKLVDPGRIPQATLTGTGVEVVAKASFGFGDVNACLLLGKAIER